MFSSIVRRQSRLSESGENILNLYRPQPGVAIRVRRVVRLPNCRTLQRLPRVNASFTELIYSFKKIFFHQKEKKMLETIAIVLVILWILGFVTSYTMGGFIHILLVIAVVIILIRVIQGRRL
jgi:fatty acid desaturase